MDVPRAKVGEHPRPLVGRHRSVDDAGRDADVVQGARQVARVADGHAERDGPPITSELLNRSRDERVALLDVHRLREVVFGEVLGARREASEVGGRRDAKAPKLREVTVVDELWKRPRVDDSLEDRIEALAVGSQRRRGEAEERAVIVGVEDPELAQDAEVVVGRRVMALVVDDEADVAPGDETREPLLVQ